MDSATPTATDAATKASKWNPILLVRKLYDWTLTWAEHKLSTYALCFLACIESFFFPIPVDPLLIAMGISKPKKALWYALLTTTFSVIGAVGGYFIGFALWEATREFFLSYVFTQQTFDAVTTEFNRNAVMAILLASFTPLPFKVFTIAAGVAGSPIYVLIICSFIGRGARFFLLAGLVRFFGEPIKEFIDKHFSNLVIAVAIVGVAGYYAIPYIIG